MTAFCDWLSVYQAHPKGGLPRINDGCVWAVDQDGVVEWTTQRKFPVVGSYDTSVRLKCDGVLVALDGNVGRLGRPDNVYGLSVAECLRKANEVVESFGLPRFSAKGKSVRYARSDSLGWDGPILTRVDLTKNFSAGSAENARRVAHYMAGQGGSRSMPKAYGTSGVTWNEGSKWWYAKLYNKADELGSHAGGRLKEWAQAIGLLRYEVSLKTRYLTQHALRIAEAWSKENSEMENVVFGRFAEVLTRNTVATVPLAEIPGRIGRIARDWLNGTDVWGGSESKETHRRWRRELLPYGIDIKFPCDVSKIGLRCEVIRLDAVQPPSWYWDAQRDAA